VQLPFPREIRAGNAVIPAKAGIHPDLDEQQEWIPAFAGMTSGKAQEGE
jgi:hypothetical protein